MRTGDKQREREIREAKLNGCRCTSLLPTLIISYLEAKPIDSEETGAGQVICHCISRLQEF